MTLRPQPGPQEAFLGSPVDIGIYGGAAGGGKTWALLYDPLRAIDDPNFRGVIFRRIMPNVTNSGGLLDESKKLYPLYGGVLRSAPRLEWRFPSGATIQFSQIQHEKDVEQYKGAQFTWIGLDELTEFTEYQFWYLLSRLRSPDSSWTPWMRCTTNPDAGSWVRGLIDWWIGPDGLALVERSGLVRHARRDGDALIWSDECDERSMSFTFVPATLADNKVLEQADPSYRKKLMLLGHVEREKLLGGNWDITAKKGLFQHAVIDKRGVLPSQLPDGLRWIRYWDLANTEPRPDNKDPDWTAGVLGALHVEYSADPDEPGRETLYIADIQHFQLSGGRKRDRIRAVAEADGHEVEVWMEQEGGATGSEAVEDYRTTHLAGYNVHFDRPTGSKVVRAGRWVGLADHGRVMLVTGPDGALGEWAQRFLAELATFPFAKKDQVDGTSGVYAVAKDHPPIYASW
jgi:phage terminase large subunit-like protein